MQLKLLSEIIIVEYLRLSNEYRTVPVNHEKRRAVKAYLWVIRAVMPDLVFFHFDKGSCAQKIVIELLLEIQ